MHFLKAYSICNTEKLCKAAQNLEQYRRNIFRHICDSYLSWKDYLNV